MEKKEFQAESKRLLDLMINSIYTHKEIFLRELISNASDSIDKIYYRALTDDSLSFNKDRYFIKIYADRESRTLRISDTGIGMTKEELEANLGTIANSGSLAFKKENELKDGYDIIGQFGVGFYSAFMVADTITVLSKAAGSSKAYKWESQGADGFTIEPCSKETVGTEIILKIKDNSEEENFDEYLDPYRLKGIIKKYSDFIRYPIRMDLTGRRLKEGSDKDYEEVTEEQTLNSMVPIWRKNKNELTDEDYANFYSEKHYGFDKPLRHIHISVEGAVRYNAILYIPESLPFDYYSKDFEKGLELYSNGVLIMHRCPDLLADYFSFAKGLVDSEDLSLNISREMLQHDRQLSLIAKNINKQIRNELLKLQNSDREAYESFFRHFGRQLKYGVYQEFGQNRDILEDLLLFHSSKEKKYVTLEEYVSGMPEEQKYIYYATGDSLDKIEKSPQTELVADKGYEILYLDEDIDEFALKVLGTFKEKEFRSVSSSDLGIEESEKPEETEAELQAESELFGRMKEFLGGKVKDVRASRRLKSHPVCLSNDGDISIEMEKILSMMPDAKDVKADKVLEVNVHHGVYEALKEADPETFALYTKLLYNQALLIEGLPLEDPVEFSNNICRLMR